MAPFLTTACLARAQPASGKVCRKTESVQALDAQRQQAVANVAACGAQVLQANGRPLTQKCQPPDFDAPHGVGPERKNGR